MKLIEKQTVERTVIVGYRCDRCGNEDAKAEDWITVSHGHSQWGNDSCESVQDFDLCSPKCYLAQLRESVEEMEGYRTGEVDHKPVAFVKALLDYLEAPGSPGYESGAGAARLNYEP